MAKIFKKLAGINKKLGKNAKFSEVVDPKKIQEAEATASRLQTFFMQAIADDFKEFRRVLERMKANNVTNREYNKIYDLSFSIKSRAGNAGIALASKVSNSLYRFCDTVLTSNFPINGYDVIKVHFHALEQIFTAKFDIENTQKSLQLLQGLETLCEKVIKDANPNPEPEPEAAA